MQQLRVWKQERALLFSIIAFTSNWNYMHSWVEHGKSCVTSGPFWSRYYLFANTSNICFNEAHTHIEIQNWLQNKYHIEKYFNKPSKWGSSICWKDQALDFQNEIFRFMIWTGLFKLLNNLIYSKTSLKRPLRQNKNWFPRPIIT